MLILFGIGVLIALGLYAIGSIFGKRVDQDSKGQEDKADDYLIKK